MPPQSPVRAGEKKYRAWQKKTGLEKVTKEGKALMKINKIMLH